MAACLKLTGLRRTRGGSLLFTRLTKILPLGTPAQEIRAQALAVIEVLATR